MATVTVKFADFEKSMEVSYDIDEQGMLDQFKKEVAKDGINNIERAIMYNVIKDLSIQIEEEVYDENKNGNS